MEMSLILCIAAGLMSIAVLAYAGYVLRKLELKEQKWIRVSLIASAVASFVCLVTEAVFMCKADIETASSLAAVSVAFAFVVLVITEQIRAKGKEGK